MAKNGDGENGNPNKTTEKYAVSSDDISPLLKAARDRNKKTGSEAEKFITSLPDQVQRNMLQNDQSAKSKATQTSTRPVPVIDTKIPPPLMTPLMLNTPPMLNPTTRQTTTAYLKKITELFEEPSISLSQIPAAELIPATNPKIQNGKSSVAEPLLGGKEVTLDKQPTALERRSWDNTTILPKLTQSLPEHGDTLTKEASPSKAATPSHPAILTPLSKTASESTIAATKASAVVDIASASPQTISKQVVLSPFQQKMARFEALAAANKLAPPRASTANAGQKLATVAKYIDPLKAPDYKGSMAISKAAKVAEVKNLTQTSAQNGLVVDRVKKLNSTSTKPEIPTLEELKARRRVENEQQRNRPASLLREAPNDPAVPISRPKPALAIASSAAEAPQSKAEAPELESFQSDRTREPRAIQSSKFKERLKLLQGDIADQQQRAFTSRTQIPPPPAPLSTASKNAQNRPQSGPLSQAANEAEVLIPDGTVRSEIAKLEDAQKQRQSQSSSSLPPSKPVVKTPATSNPAHAPGTVSEVTTPPVSKTLPVPDVDVAAERNQTRLEPSTHSDPKAPPPFSQAAQAAIDAIASAFKATQKVPSIDTHQRLGGTISDSKDFIKIHTDERVTKDNDLVGLPSDSQREFTKIAQEKRQNRCDFKEITWEKQNDKDWQIDYGGANKIAAKSTEVSIDNKVVKAHQIDFPKELNPGQTQHFSFPARDANGEDKDHIVVSYKDGNLAAMTVPKGLEFDKSGQGYFKDEIGSVCAVPISKDKYNEMCAQIAVNIEQGKASAKNSSVEALANAKSPECRKQIEEIKQAQASSGVEAKSPPSQKPKTTEHRKKFSAMEKNSSVAEGNSSIVAPPSGVRVKPQNSIGR